MILSESRIGSKGWIIPFSHRSVLFECSIPLVVSSLYGPFKPHGTAGLATLIPVKMPGAKHPHRGNILLSALWDMLLPITHTGGYGQF